MGYREKKPHRIAWSLTHIKEAQARLEEIELARIQRRHRYAASADTSIGFGLVSKEKVDTGEKKFFGNISTVLRNSASAIRNKFRSIKK